MSNEGSNYYLARKKRLLKAFDGYAKYTWPVAARTFGDENCSKVIQEVRQEFEILIPQLPYIGGKQPFTQFLIATGIFLAMYRVTSRRGLNVDQTGVLIFQICQGYLDAAPTYLARWFGSMNFSKFYLGRLQKRARESQARVYPDDYVYTFIPGDDQTFDYGVDYLQCAGCQFLARQGAPELAKYLCPVDVLYSQALGWGLTRTMTLAEGAEKCDFRFKRGGPTRVAVPVALSEIVTS